MAEAEQRPPRVFVSYRQEPDRPEHADRVLAFADRLIDEGIATDLDQYEPNPPDGWPTWCERRILAADFVLLVCTAAYRRAVEGDESPGSGHGVLWEARLIRQLLYDAGSSSAKLVPVLFSDGSPEDIPLAFKGPSWHFVDRPDGWENLYRQLTDQPRARRPELGKLRKLPERERKWRDQALGELHGVPELPRNFVARSDEVAALVEKLTAANAAAVGITGTALRVGVQGMGGIGKSVLAASAVRSEVVRVAFSGGIFWIGLGRNPDLQVRLADLHWLLTLERENFADAQQARLALQRVLRERARLIVLDDVWHLVDVEAFNIADTSARLLLTTRDASIVRTLGANEHEVDQLEPKAALRLLEKTAGIAEGQAPLDAEAIAEECRGLPLALALAGGMIGGRPDMWGPVLNALKTADLEQLSGEFPGYPYPHVFAAIEASVSGLDGQREYYLDLAIFPEEVPIPNSVLAELWRSVGGGNALDVRRRINLFRDRSLVREIDGKGILLHDLQRDFVQRRAENIADRHRRLVEAWRVQRPNGWDTGPVEEYFFRFLLLHLAGAKRSDELQRLLVDTGWIAAKLAATDLPALLADYALTSDPTISLMERALVLSAHIIGKNHEQLAGQLVGRLRGVAGLDGELLSEVNDNMCGELWFRPRTRSLTPPGSLLRLFPSDRNWVNCVAPLVDGRRAISGSEDGTLRLWDLVAGTELRRFKGHKAGVRAVVPLGDGLRTLSASNDGTLRLWDLRTDAELRRFEGHEGSVGSAVLVPGGNCALSGSEDGTLRLWDLDAGVELRRFSGGDAWVTSVAPLPDGRRALSGATDGMVRLWRLETGAELRRYEGHKDEVTAVAPIPAGHRAMSGSLDRTLRLWDLETGTELRRFEGHRDWVTSLAPLPDGLQALSGSKDGMLWLWDLESGERRRAFEGHQASVKSVIALSDGRRALSGSDDGTVRLWDLEITTKLARSAGHDGQVTSVLPLSDGRRFVSCSGDGTVRLWELESGVELSRVKGYDGVIQAVAALPDGRVLSGSRDGILRLWDPESWTELRQFEGHENSVASIAVLPGGRRALSGSTDRTVRLWDLDTGTELRRSRSLEAGVGSIVLVSEGFSALLSPGDGTVRLWNLHTDAETFLFGGNGTWVTPIATLPDGHHALSGSMDRTVRLWDSQIGTERFRLSGHEGRVNSVAVLANGRRALSGSDDRTLRLWDLETRQCLAVFTGDAAITAVAVVRDDLIVAGSANGAIHILDLIEPSRP